MNASKLFDSYWYPLHIVDIIISFFCWSQTIFFFVWTSNGNALNKKKTDWRLLPVCVRNRILARWWIVNMVEKCNIFTKNEKKESLCFLLKSVLVLQRQKRQKYFETTIDELLRLHENHIWFMKSIMCVCVFVRFALDGVFLPIASDVHLSILSKTTDDNIPH